MSELIPENDLLPWDSEEDSENSISWEGFCLMGMLFAIVIWATCINIGLTDQWAFIIALAGSLVLTLWSRIGNKKDALEIQEND